MNDLVSEEMAAMRRNVDEVIARVNARPMTPAAYAARRAGRRAKRFGLMLAAGVLALMVGTGVWAAILGPIGIFGVLAMAILLGIIVVGALALSGERPVKAASIVRADLPQLADRTNSWLGQQRRALPAPAQTLADSIGERIANLAPSLETLDANGPQAVELKRLVGEELPELVDRYRQVPPAMRRAERNGRVAEKELIEGLAVVDAHLGTLASDLAAADMDRLASHTRYLETRYRDGVGSDAN